VTSSRFTVMQSIHGRKLMFSAASCFSYSKGLRGRMCQEAKAEIKPVTTADKSVSECRIGRKKRGSVRTRLLPRPLPRAHKRQRMATLPVRGATDQHCLLCSGPRGPKVSFEGDRTDFRSLEFRRGRRRPRSRHFLLGFTNLNPLILATRVGACKPRPGGLQLRARRTKMH